MKLTPKNWQEFQHYKDRRPAWIKLHRELLDNYEFHCLPVASKALAPLLWLLASEYEDGTIDDSDEKISFRLRLPVADMKRAVTPLIDSGFFVASDMLAGCHQESIPEKRREEKRENEFSDEIFCFEEVWKAYPERDGNKKKVQEKVVRQISNGHSGEDLKKALRNYLEHVRIKRSGGFKGLNYQNRQTWFNNWQQWIDWEPPKESRHDPSKDKNWGQ